MTIPSANSLRITAPFYPIVYVRGFAPTIAGGLENTFHDLYYGYAETAVEPRQKSPDQATGGVSDRVALDLFEGQLIRFIKEFAYVDATHGGLELATSADVPHRPLLDPTRSLWISRFYDTDFLTDTIRTIDQHAEELWTLISDEIPTALEAHGVDLGPNRSEYKVILIAHSMGGLVCRALMQGVMPKKEIIIETEEGPAKKTGISPDTLIHRLVTIASPHGGIDFGSVPNFFEDFVVKTFNPGGTRMFKEDDMRQYLDLERLKEGTKDFVYPLNSLGELTVPGAPFTFSPDKCLSLIGSDYHSYSAVQKLTGGYSDGLVKQDKAFIEGAYTVNVHRAHSGFRGIVNSFESFENIHRFLFGDTKVALELTDVQIPGADTIGEHGFYNFEFSLAIRNAGGVLLHQRRENPCQNAIRTPAALFAAGGEGSAKLHEVFLNSRRRPRAGREESIDDFYLHFLLGFRVVEHRVARQLLWDREYPERAIYSESLEIRVNTDAVDRYYQSVEANVNDPNVPIEPLAPDALQYEWQSDTGSGWKNAPAAGDHFDIPLREAQSVRGNLRLTPTLWNV